MCKLHRLGLPLLCFHISPNYHSYGCGKASVELYVIEPDVTCAYNATVRPLADKPKATLIMGCESGKYLMEIPTGFYVLLSIGLSELE